MLLLFPGLLQISQNPEELPFSLRMTDHETPQHWKENEAINRLRFPPIPLNSFSLSFSCLLSLSSFLYHSRLFFSFFIRDLISLRSIFVCVSKSRFFRISFLLSHLFPFWSKNALSLSQTHSPSLSQALSLCLSLTYTCAYTHTHTHLHSCTCAHTHTHIHAISLTLISFLSHTSVHNYYRTVKDVPLIGIASRERHTHRATLAFNLKDTMVANENSGLGLSPAILVRFFFQPG